MAGAVHGDLKGTDPPLKKYSFEVREGLVVRFPGGDQG